MFKFTYISSSRSIYRYKNYFNPTTLNSLINNKFFITTGKKHFSRRPDIAWESDIQRKLKEKWDIKSEGINLKKNHNMAAQFASVQFDKIKNEDLKDLLQRYCQHVSDREKRRLNFNRKDRWQQRELDDIMKNFDVKQAKFKDYSKLAIDANIINIKEFHNVEEIYFYLKDLLKEGFLEQQLGMALDVFIKDIRFFKQEDVEKADFKNFVQELSKNLISLSDDKIIYKAAKFLDWYNIDNKNCWYNLERVIVNRKDCINKSTLLKIFDHFAHQNEGSMEFYDLYQYFFWSDEFKNVSNSEFISLGYNLFLTRQGYSQFFYDYYKQLLPRISYAENTFDLLKVIQTYSEISEYYMDVYKKIEDIILSRYEQLELNEATVIACGYAISGLGSNLLFEYLEKLITNKFTSLDKNGFRETVRALIVSLNGSKQFFELIKHNLKFNLDLFNVTEKVYIVKCYFDRNEGDKEFFKSIEKSLMESLTNNGKELLLEEICAVADCLCHTSVFSREFQKLLEHVISMRIKEINGNPKVSQFLYDAYYKTGMCSVGLMNVLMRAYNNTGA